MPLYMFIFITAVAVCLAFLEPSPSPAPHFIISDENGNILSVVSVNVMPGDEFLTAQNELYLITDVSQNLAHAQFIRKIYLH